ncbi:MAG: SRPBCC family protein [Deltaproteobacteria bacterium]|nr:SRPBCC family protein [Deltaproteobacteria bacterium]
MLKKILLGIGAVLGLAVVGVCGAAAMAPDQLHVERSATFAAQPADISPFLTDMKAFADWNPWRDYEPTATLGFSENPSGVGAWYTWKGEEIGSGKMTVASAAENKVEHDLEFVEPFPSKADVTFSFAPEGEGTKVTWSLDEQQDFMGKLFGVFVNMDEMLGGDFTKGLAKLKPRAEEAAKQRVEAEAKAKAEAEAEAAAAAVAEGAVVEVPVQ